MITVKPLEWELVDDDHYAARGLGIGYEVRKSQIRETVRVRFASGVFGEWQDFDGDIEAAKDAAFADYSARIMSAIEPAGVGVENPPPSPHVTVSIDAKAKLELWFFRDMFESNRLALFSLFGFKAAEMDTMGKQQMVFRRILASIAEEHPSPRPNVSGYEFDRYVNGRLMAEGVTVEKAKSFEEAMVTAARLASRGPNGEVPVLVLRLPSPQPRASVPAALKGDEQ